MVIGGQSDGPRSSAVMGIVSHQDVGTHRSRSKTLRQSVLAIATVCLTTAVWPEASVGQAPKAAASTPVEAAASATADSPLVDEARELLEIIRGARDDLVTQRKALIERITKLEGEAEERSKSEPQPANDRQMAQIGELEGEIADLDRQISETATIETRSEAMRRYLDRRDQLTPVPYFADGFEPAVSVQQTQKDVEMRQGPDSRWPVVGRIKRGGLAVVLAKEKGSDWRLVASDEHYGYVREKDLSEVRQ